MLRANDDKLQQRIARRLGEVNETVVNRNQQLAVTEWRDGGGLSQTDRDKFIVSPGDIGNLDTCVGYLKLVGSLPAAKVDYRKWLPKAPGRPSYIDRWKEVNVMPKRDPRFLIVVTKDDDVFKTIRDEVQLIKKKKAEEEEVQKTVRVRIPNADEAKPDAVPASVKMLGLADLFDDNFLDEPHAKH